MRSSAFLCASLLLAPLCLHAQAHPGCPEFPKTLAAMRGCYRPVLIFSPSGKDPRFLKQEAILDAAADDMMDRNMLLAPVLEEAKTFTRPLDADSIVLPRRKVIRARRRFHIRRDQFRVILLGEDGSAKLSSHEPVSIKRFDALIDAMPMRKVEEQHRDSN